jgi:DNA-binding MarR family transcriptional regulator
LTESPSESPSTSGFDFDTESEPVQRRLVNGLVKISLAARHRAWQEAVEQGLTPTQGQALTLLRVRGETGMRLTELAAALAITPATTSETVDTLVTKGLVNKARAADDGRAVQITLTEQGQRAADNAAGWSDFLLTAIDALSPAEQEVFLRGVIKMIRTLQERGEIPISRMCVTCQFFRPNRHPSLTHPHHCAYVDAPFGDRHLRLECGEHVPADPDQAERAWQIYLAPAD